MKTAFAILLGVVIGFVLAGYFYSDQPAVVDQPTVNDQLWQQWLGEIEEIERRKEFERRQEFIEGLQ